MIPDRDSTCIPESNWVSAFIPRQFLVLVSRPLCPRPNAQTYEEPSARIASFYAQINQETKFLYAQNTLDRYQSNYSSRIVFSHIGLPIEFGPIQNSGIRSADPENPTLHCVSKKWGTHIMPHNSHKCGPILIFLSLSYSWVNCRKRWY